MTGNLVPELKKIASTLEPDNVMIQRSSEPLSQAARHVFREEHKIGAYLYRMAFDSSDNYDHKAEMVICFTPCGHRAQKIVAAAADNGALVLTYDLGELSPDWTWSLTRFR